METLTIIVVVLAVLGLGVTYGTDAFAGAVWNAALGKLDEASLTQVSGWVHHFGDRRLPVPGAIGTISATVAAILGWIDGDLTQALLRTVAAVCAFAWLGVYVGVAKPINERFSAAAAEGVTLPHARAEHAAWNRIIPIRVGLLMLTLALLVVSVA